MLLKTVLATLVAVIMVFGLAVTPVLATADQEGITVTITPEDEANNQDDVMEPDDSEEDASDVETDLEEDEEKILTPESPFYFLKRFVESVKLFLTFDEDKKVQLLSELAEERAKELEALQQQFADGELTEKQFNLLEKALDALLLSTEKLIDTLIPLDEDSNGNPDQDDLEEPDEDNDDEQDTIDPIDIEDDEDDKDTVSGDKYLDRVAHLQSIADRAPESAQKGLARAIANALRQRERAIAKGKIICDDPEEIELDTTEDSPETALTEEITSSPEDENSKIKKEKETKVKENNGNNKANPGNGRGPSRTGPGRGNGKN